MKLSQITQLGSVRAINMVFSRIATSQASMAWGQYKKQQRAMPYASTNQQAYAATMECDTKLAQHARNFWTVVAVLDSRSFTVDVSQVLEFICSSGSKPKTNEQITEISRASGLSESAIRKGNDEARMKALAVGASLRAGFTSRFGEYEFEGADNEVDIEVPATTVLATIENLKAKIASWDRPDLAELMMLKHDADICETIATREEDYKERAGEGSREMDDRMLSGSDMGAAAQVK